MAFDASERSKVRSLLDLLTASSQDAPCDELLERQLNTEPSTRFAAAVAEQTASPSTAPTLTLKQVQAEIEDDDAVLLEYALGDEKSYVWVIDQHQITSYELPQSDRIRKLVEAFRETLVPPQLRDGESAADYQARVRKLDQAYRGLCPADYHDCCLGPLLWVGQSASSSCLTDLSNTSRLLPFHFLALGEAKDFLVDHFEVDVLPSASVLGTLRKTNSDEDATNSHRGNFCRSGFRTR